MLSQAPPGGSYKRRHVPDDLSGGFYMGKEAEVVNGVKHVGFTAGEWRRIYIPVGGEINLN